MAIPSSPKKSAQNGNIFFMLFASVALVGAIGVGATNHLKGIVTSMSEVTRKTVAEEKMTGGARLSIQAATSLQAHDGDCDQDGMVEPLDYRDAGAAVHPTGGGYIPLNIGAEPLDPWGTPYGYCVWDAGTTFDHADCGGPGARRLRGAPTTIHPVVAIISAGKDRRFTTTCNGYVDTTPADGNPDTPLIGRVAGGDDVILEYTYNDASGMSGDDLWKVRDTAPDTSMIDKNIEVTGSGQFSGPINLMQAGLILPADPGDDSVTGACDATTDQQLRVNTGMSPPSFEICHDNEWERISLGGNANYNTPTETGKLLANDAATTDLLGSSVAISGNNAIAIAPQDDDIASNTGSAYVYSKVGGTWTQVEKLMASDAAINDGFGNATSMSGDNAIIGTPYNDDAGTSSGSAYIFTNSGGGWSQAAKLTASDAAGADRFGFDVGISGDYAIIGAPLDDDGGSATGSAYIFTKSSGVWVQTAKLNASDAAIDDQFGTSVAISGNTVIVGAHYDDDGGSNAGSAYIFTRSGASWTQTAKLTASDAAADDTFGVSVGISGDAAIVGAPLNDDSGVESGSAYIFKKSAGVWSEAIKMTASDAAASDHFGRSVDISGYTALVGSPRDDDGGGNSGSAYLFKKSGGVWAQHSKLVASDPAANDSFGNSIGLSGDSAIIGSHLNDDVAADTGSAYIFEGLCLGQPCGISLESDEITAIPTKGLMKDPSFLECSAAGKGPLVKVSESTSSDYRLLALDDNYLYAASNTSGLTAFSKENGILTPITTQFAGTPYANIWRYGSHIFAAATVSGIFAYAFDGTTFTQTGSMALTDARSIWGDGRYFYVADGAFGIRALTYDGVSFTQVAVLDTPGLAVQVWGDGRFIYLSDRTGGLRILTFDGTAFSEIEVAENEDIVRSWGDGELIYVTVSGGNTLVRYAFDGENLTPYTPVPLIGNPSSLWGDGSNIFVANTAGELFAGKSSGNSIPITSAYKLDSLNVRSIVGDGSYIYAGQATGKVTSFSGYACGSSAELNPAVVVAANKYRGKITSSNFSCGIKPDNTAWCWGFNASGQLGNGGLIDKTAPSIVSSTPTSNNYSQISAGIAHTCAIKNDGTAWCWGRNLEGQLGNGLLPDGNIPSLVQTGANDRWSQISAGNRHTCGIKTDGTAWCWGTGANGELGNGTPGMSAIPVLVSDPGPWVYIAGGLDTTCGIKVDGSAWCWGLNDKGQLGNGTFISSSIPVIVSEPGPWAHIGRQNTTTCGVKLDGTAWCWGAGNGGKRADGIHEPLDYQVIPQRINDEGPWLEIDASMIENTTMCGLKIDGTAWCWGSSGIVGSGKRGDGVLITDVVTYPVRVTDAGPWATLSMGPNHVCGIKIDGSAWCWGQDGEGRLGNGDSITANQAVPTRVYNFPNAAPWQWDTTQTSMSKALPSAQVIAPPTSSIGYDDVSGGLSFDGTAKTLLRTPSGNAELMVDSNDATSSAQISFDAQDLASAKTIGIDRTNFNLEFGINNGAASNWIIAITPQMSITPQGNVAIGSGTTANARLDITGSGLKVGNETRTCAPSRQGALRYIGGAEPFEYCNGTAWVAF